MPLKKFKATLVPKSKEVSQILRKRLLSTAMAGEIASSLKGKGLEFEDYRDYTNTDDADRIDWRATQRAQRLLVRQYKIEINFNVFFLIDTSETMLFASTPKLKCEYAAEVVTSIFYGVLQAGNAVGFGLFNEGIYRIAKPLLGQTQFYTYTREISKPENYGGRKNLSISLQHAMAILDKRALVFVVSDFLTQDTKWATLLNIMSQRHEVLGIMIRDPRDAYLPKDAGQLVIGDPSSDGKIYVDSRDYFEKYNKEADLQVNMVRTIFKGNNSRFFDITTDQDYLHPLMNFFKKGGGRWR